MDFLIASGSINLEATWPKTGNSVLHWAATHGELETVKHLVEVKADLNAINIAGETAAIIAAESKHDAVVSFLISLDLIDINMCCPKTGYSLAHYCAKTGNMEVLEQLLDKHANFDLLNKKGYSPALLAASKGHEIVVNLLISQGGVNLDVVEKR